MENKKTLALVMIVKDEERGLAAAIESAKPYVDEIVIAIDSKSFDNSERIAREYTENVEIFTFFDDFSAARNRAAENVKSDYILFLDGHEILTKCENLQDHLNKNYDVLLVPIRMENGMLFSGGRIYKNGLQFEGRIHERVQGNFVGNVSDILITHNRNQGQDPISVAARSSQRDEHMTKIMQGELEDNPKNLRNLFHLVLYYQSKHDLKNANKFLRKYVKYSNEPGGRWYVYYNQALLHFSDSHYFRALMATRDAIKENPTRWEISYLRGMIFHAMGKWQLALASFVESMNDNAGIIDFMPMPRNLGATFNYIGECLFQQKRYFEAGESFLNASRKTDDKMFRELLERRAFLMSDLAKQSK
jgi:glycosyltransferase involved in cell wall biosynthesis